MGQAHVSAWDGTGRWESYSVGIPNGQVVYSVFWAKDRLSEDGAVEAGVRIETRGKYTGTVACDTRQPITQALTPEGAAASAHDQQQAGSASARKEALLADFADKCEAALPFDLINDIGNRMYFGHSYWSAASARGPVVVVYMGEHELPKRTGRRLIYAPSKLGQSSIKLESGRSVLATVYGAGDKECMAMAQAIRALPR